MLASQWLRALRKEPALWLVRPIPGSNAGGRGRLGLLHHEAALCRSDRLHFGSVHLSCSLEACVQEAVPECRLGAEREFAALGGVEPQHTTQNRGAWPTSVDLDQRWTSVWPSRPMPRGPFRGIAQTGQRERKVDLCPQLGVVREFEPIFRAAWQLGAGRGVLALSLRGCAAFAAAEAPTDSRSSLCRNG